MQCEPRVNKSSLARRFARAAHNYDDWSELQCRTGQKLLQLLPSDQHWPCALDLGCGTGYFLPELHRRCHRLAGLDLCPEMLLQARRRSPTTELCRGDAENLPYASQSFDLVFSNLMLQWCNQLDRAFSEIKAIMKPGGLCVFSTLLQGTLGELDHVWQQQGREPCVNRFISREQLEQALIRSGLQLVQGIEQAEVIHRADFKELLMTIKGIGASEVNRSPGCGLMGRQTLVRLERSYQQFREQNGLLPATYQLFYGVVTNE